VVAPKRAAGSREQQQQQQLVGASARFRHPAPSLYGADAVDASGQGRQRRRIANGDGWRCEHGSGIRSISRSGDQ